MQFLRSITLAVALSLVAGAASAQAPRPDDPAAVADLVIDLGAAEPHVRDQARAGLVRIGGPAVPALVAVLTGGNGRARFEAVRALGAIGSPARAAIPDLERLIGPGDPALADAVKSALATIDPVRHGASAGGTALRVADIVLTLDSRDAVSRLTAIRQLGEVRGPESPAAAEALAARLVAPDDAIRIALLRSLASLGPAAAPAASRVVDALVAGRPAVRAAALDALARVPDAAVPPLLRALARVREAQSDDAHVAPWISAAFWDAGPAVAGPARAALTAGEPFLAAAAADALGAALAVDPESVAAVVTASREGAGIVRRRAAVALGAFGGTASEFTVDPLTALLADRESRAQVEAAESLRQVLVDLAERPARPARSPADVERAIEAGLDWLVAHQDEDGRFDCDGFERHDPPADRSGGAGGPENDVGVSGLAALALLRSGATGRAGAEATWHDTSLRRALRWIAAQQAADGCLVPHEHKHWVYGHAIGALALAEAWARTRCPLWGAAAQRALDYLAAARNPDGAWHYDFRPTSSDTSVNGWCVQAMRAGERAGLRVDPAYAPHLLRYLVTVSNPQTGDVAYQPNSERRYESARTNEMLPRFPPKMTTAMTSSAALQRLLLGQDARSERSLSLGLERIQALPPVWDVSSGRIDLYSWLPGTETMNLVGGDAWTKWKAALRGALVPSQVPAKGGARAGSWDPCDPWSDVGGRLYTTSMAVLCLEVHQGAVAGLPRDPTRDGRGLRAARALDAAAKDTSNHQTVRDAARAALEAARGP